jgi:hypothetical protein
MSKRTPSPEQIDKERQVIELRRAGATFDDIARTLNYANPSGAWQAYNRALQRTLVTAGAEEARTEELDRLDRLQRAVWGNAMQGEIASVQAVLRIMDRRAKYLGLDAPVKQEVTIEHIDPNSVDAEIMRLVEMLKDNDGTTQKQQP